MANVYSCGFLTIWQASIDFESEGACTGKMTLKHTNAQECDHALSPYMA